MPKSARLRTADTRAAFLLAGECRDLGDDPFIWRQHYFSGIGRLADVGLVLGGEQAGLATGATRDIGNTSWGWHNGFSPAGWEQALADLAKNPVYSAPLTEYGRRADGNPCLSRTDLVADREWDGSPDHIVIAAIGGRFAAYCFSPIPERPGETSGFFVVREANEPDFTTRQKATIQEAQAVVGRMVGGPLARFAEPSPAELPRRVRQVLKCFLEGDSDKLVGLRLGLSRHTVNQYAKHIHRHFGVTTRGELLARWLKRGWGNRCAWAADLGDR